MTSNRRIVRVPGGRKHSLGRVKGADVDKLGVLAMQAQTKSVRCEQKFENKKQTPQKHSWGRKHGRGCV